MCQIIKTEDENIVEVTMNRIISYCIGHNQYGFYYKGNDFKLVMERQVADLITTAFYKEYELKKSRLEDEVFLLNEQIKNIRAGYDFLQSHLQKDTAIEEVQNNVEAEDNQLVYKELFDNNVSIEEGRAKLGYAMVA